jgi:hypothetical protein
MSDGDGMAGCSACQRGYENHEYYCSGKIGCLRGGAEKIVAKAAQAALPADPAAGRKDDGGKPTFDLLPYAALAEVQRVLEYGAKKYEAWNWARGMRWLRLWNAVMRHLWAWVRGEDDDPESGLPHLACAVCSLLFLLEYRISGLGTDDRRLPAPRSCPTETPPTRMNRA